MFNSVVAVIFVFVFFFCSIFLFCIDIFFLSISHICILSILDRARSYLNDGSCGILIMWCEEYFDNEWTGVSSDSHNLQQLKAIVLVPPLRPHRRRERRDIHISASIEKVYFWPVNKLWILSNKRSTTWTNRDTEVIALLYVDCDRSRLAT